MTSLTQPTQRSPTSAIEIFLTETDLAERWQVAVKTLQNARVAGGGVPYLKLGRAVRYRLTDVLAYEEARLRHNTSEGE